LRISFHQFPAGFGVGFSVRVVSAVSDFAGGARFCFSGLLCFGRAVGFDLANNIAYADRLAGGDNIFASRPACGADNSRVFFSESMTATGSSAFTVSPSALSHSANLNFRDGFADLGDF